METVTPAAFSPTSVYPSIEDLEVDTQAHASRSLTDNLKQLQDAKNSKMISDDEFDRMRANLLAGHSQQQKVPSVGTASNVSLLASSGSEATVRRTHWCSKIFRLFSLLLVFLSMLFAIAAICMPTLSEVWVDCPDSGYASTCNLPGNKYCLDYKRHDHRHYHDDDDDHFLQHNGTWCDCGQEYYKVGIKTIEWINATDELDRTKVWWSDISDADSGGVSVFPDAKIKSDMEMTSSNYLLVDFKEMLHKYRIISYVLLTFTILVFLDLLCFVKTDCKSDVFMDETKRAKKSARQSRRAIRIPIMLVFLFALGMTSFILIATQGLVRTYSHAQDMSTLAAYYPDTCTLNSHSIAYGIVLTEHSLCITAAMLLMFSALFRHCCNCKGRTTLPFYQRHYCEPSSSLTVPTASASSRVAPSSTNPFSVTPNPYSVNDKVPPPYDAFVTKAQTSN